MNINCRHFTNCSGCVYSSCEEPPELFVRASTFLKSHFSVDLQLKQGKVQGWRSRAKLAVRASHHLPHIGLFEKNSHHVIEIPECRVHHPKINEAVKQLKQALQKTSLSAYDETSGRGDLRYLQLVVERHSKTVQLTCVLNCTPEATTSWQEFCSHLFDTQQEPLWHSFWINCHPEQSNRIFGPTWIHVCGKEDIWESLDGKNFAFGPQHFGQANLAMYEQLIRDIHRKLQPGRKLAELYAGIGIIGICVSDKCDFVRFCEVQKQALGCFEKAKERLVPHEQQKLSYLVAPAEASIELLEGVDTCIVDPPRKGLGPEYLSKILATPTLETLIYVSCDWMSLERDCLCLLKHHPEWYVQEATSYLFFPGTNQIETALFLSKR